jgi:hypothetical protein
MTRARPHGRNLIVALLAAVGLLLQGAIGMSPAWGAATGQTIEICTGHGSKTVTLDQAGHPSAPQQAPCPHCDQCLSLVLAVSATAPLLVQPVRYAARTELAPAVLISAASARGPPRPPSQAPPLVLNV